MFVTSRKMRLLFDNQRPNVLNSPLRKPVRMLSSDNNGDISREDRQSTYEFVDKVTIVVKGGRGGNGCISFECSSPGTKKPSGGTGGRGGNIYIQADPELNSLKFQTFHYNARDGKHGGSAGMTGRNGRDTYIKVPIGTTVTEKIREDLYDVLEAEGYEPLDMPTVRLDDPKGALLVAMGGKAGLGNSVSKQKAMKSTPATKMPGEHGQERVLHLELKIIADVGLVGFPNAGKSSLVRALSNATPKVDSYAFTTLHPSVGVVEYSDLERITVADIPGLIDGASEDRGLGHDFLKHIERTKVLLFVLDMAGVDKRKPHEDLEALINELRLYDETLLDRPALIFANKHDLAVPSKSEKTVESLARQYNMKIIRGSAQKGTGLPEVARELRLMVSALKKEEAERLKAEGVSADGPKKLVFEPKRKIVEELEEFDEDEEGEYKKEYDNEGDDDEEGEEEDEDSQIEYTYDDETDEQIYGDKDDSEAEEAEEDSRPPVRGRNKNSRTRQTVLYSGSISK